MGPPFFPPHFSPRGTFTKQTGWSPVQRGGGGRKTRPDGRGAARRDERRGVTAAGRADRYGNEVKREAEIRTFPPLPLCVYPSEKRANKTFIIPGKLSNVFDIKRLKRRRERDREREGTDRQMDERSGRVSGSGSWRN